MGPICPVCREVFGTMEGDQPEGNMTWENHGFPGFPKCGQIVINYDIPSVCHTEKHPNPGRHYPGVHRTAHLPDNREGKEELRLLKRAFDQKLIFTIWNFQNDCGGQPSDLERHSPQDVNYKSFGDPDPHYLSRVKEELKAKGIK